MSIATMLIVEMSTKLAITGTLFAGAITWVACVSYKPKAQSVAYDFKHELGHTSQSELVWQEAQAAMLDRLSHLSYRGLQDELIDMEFNRDELISCYDQLCGSGYGPLAFIAFRKACQSLLDGNQPITYQSIEDYFIPLEK